MTKADLVRQVAAASGLTKMQAARMLDTATVSITAALRKGRRVSVGGLGTFTTAQRKAHSGRDPQTGLIRISPNRVAKFTPDAKLKIALNQASPDAFVSAMEELSAFY